ncbi:phage scaffold protein [Pseudoalteromonas rubra]|uniref:Phage scaffold protein n=1 Tax=Pseudoalteromonas rubra TaxID=43658 RepID=A0A5S3WKI2_9GAMM|nr:phage protease [Pseudoalteromonas rubra]TMP27201.1 phage scaffold protein [Pseudoalteromonas rubra]TMP29497.1 phage scaffold protein [Pseudoalteromonas rubra]
MPQTDPQQTTNNHSKQSHTIATAVVALTTDRKDSYGVAVCKLSADINEQGVSPRVQLMPDGPFKSHHDGRPGDVASGHWLLDDTAWQFLQANAALRNNDYHFDYEHQTMLAESNGQPAPASGWFKPADIEYVPGQGLFALNVKWTKRASDLIKNDEYRYVSPVFSYDKQTGRPVALKHFALTNDPALDGLSQVVALKTQFPNQPGETPMNEALKLLAELGITVADGQNPEPQHYDQGMAALTALKAKAESADNLTTQLNDATQQVAALKANNTNSVDLSQYVPKAVADAYRTELAALKSQNDGLSIDQEIENARKNGRVLAAEVDWLKDLADQQGFAVLKANLDARSPIAALTAQQTTQTKLPDGKQTGVAALTTEDKYAADQLGISYKDYAKLKEDDQ